MQFLALKCPMTRLHKNGETDVSNDTRCVVLVPLTQAEQPSRNPRDKDQSLYDEENDSREHVFRIDGRDWAWKIAFVVEFAPVHYQSISCQQPDSRGLLTVQKLPKEDCYKLAMIVCSEKALIKHAGLHIVEVGITCALAVLCRCRIAY